MNTIAHAHVEFEEYPARIIVVGVGGCGGNALNRMVSCNLKGIDFVAMNTDKQALRGSQAGTRLQIGQSLLQGLGAGAEPENGRLAALENIDTIKEILHGADMVFVTAGMGGGTGTGAAPIIAEVAKELDILTLGVVTLPFNWEGNIKRQIALTGLNELKKHVDTLITIQNDRLFLIMDDMTPATAVFQIVDDVLRQAVQAVSEIIIKPGRINRDFNDVKKILKDSGEAWIGMGEATGDNKAVIACRKAMENPMLENVSINGARKILVNITISPNTTLKEIDQGMNLIKDATGDDVEVLFGTVLDEKMEDDIKFTIIASGFPEIKHILPIGTKEINQFKKSGESQIKNINIEMPAYLVWKKKSQ